MVTPDFLNEVVKAVEDKVSDLQEYLIKKIASHVVGAFYKGEKNVIIPSTASDMRKLMDSGMVLEDIEKAVTKAIPDINKTAKDAFLESAKEISNNNTEITKDIVETIGKNGETIEIEVPNYNEIGLPNNASELNMTPTEIRRMEQIYKATNKTVSNLCHTMPQEGHNAYIEACDKAFMKVQSGVSIDTAIREAIKDMAKKGLFVHYEDKKDRIEVAIARAVRTGINKANSEIVLTRCAEMGVGFVKVSSHLGARVTNELDYTNHAHWQGKVYSLDWNNNKLSKFKPTVEVDNENESKGFGYLAEIRKFFKKLFKNKKYDDFIESTGYGEIQGLCGVNCRHTFSPFNPDVRNDDNDTVDYEKNKKRYDLTQKQRAKERHIRELKRQYEALKSCKDDMSKIERKILKKELEKAVDDYMDFCAKNDLKPRNWSLEIAK